MTHSPDAAPRRIRIVGVSGSGKSHLADRVAARTGFARLELDAIFWDAGWQRRDVAEAHALIGDFLADHPSGWVADGNWTKRLAGRLDPGTADGADVVVWLDHPRALVMRRIIARTIRRGVLRTPMWHGNRERMADWVRWDPSRNIMRWAWTDYPRVRERMLARIAAGEPILRLRTGAEIDAWLATLPSEGRSVRV